MSQSIRLSDTLIAQAKRTGKLLHRSPPEQIEHWAQIGRVMETALSYPAQEQVKRAATRADLDAALAAVGTTDGKRRARAVITRTAATIVTRD